MLTQKLSNVTVRDISDRNMAQPSKSPQCPIPTVRRMNNLLFLAKALSR